MKGRNNRLIGYGLGLILYALALLSEWAVLKPNGGQGVIFPLTLNAMTGSLGLEGVSIPIWILLLISAVTTVICALNCSGFSSVPKLPLYAALAITGLYYLWPLALKCIHPHSLDLRAGPGLAFLANYWVFRLTYTETRASPAQLSSA